MTVGELRALLAEQPDDRIVLVEGLYGKGFSDIFDDFIELRRVAEASCDWPEDNAWTDISHVPGSGKSTSPRVKTALVLHRAPGDVSFRRRLTGV